MDREQRFLRRLYLMEQMELWLREAQYHRNHDESEALANAVLWHWDETDGMTEVS